MDLNYLKKILKIFDQSSLSDLTIEEDGIKISLSRKLSSPVEHVPSITDFQDLLSKGNKTTDTISLETSKIEDKVEVPKETPSVSYYKLNSPMVGTFFRSPSPEAEPFVEVGSHVVPGQTLCIIEAMKVMNEIQSDVAGTVVEIVVENGKPVEYNQTLMLIKPD